jgi:predicted nucleic acid-binding protein
MRCAANGARPSANSGARAVRDPNVLVSAAISPAGPPRQIHTAWTNERFELIASPDVLDELADVLARPKFGRFITTAIAVAFIDGLATTPSSSRTRQSNPASRRTPTTTT